MQTTVIQHVPADQVDKYIRLYFDAGATEVKKIAEGNGLYTLIPIYPGQGRPETVVPEDVR